MDSRLLVTGGLAANANPGADVIRSRTASGQISLTSGQLLITEGVTIEGPGADLLAADANRAVRLGPASAVAVRGPTPRNGRRPSVRMVAESWAAAPPASLTLEECAIAGNTVPDGLASAETAGCQESVATLVARRCLADNVVEAGSGGAVHLNRGTTARLENCTLPGTRSAARAAQSSRTSTQLTMESHCHCEHGRGGGGAEFHYPFPVSATASPAQRCACCGAGRGGSVTSQGYNLIANASRALDCGDRPGQYDPLLGPRQQRRADDDLRLLPGSPLERARPPATDQRGAPAQGRTSYRRF